jgi:hypothetical protein
MFYPLQRFSRYISQMRDVATAFSSSKGQCSLDSRISTTTKKLTM